MSSRQDDACSAASGSLGRGGLAAEVSLGTELTSDKAADGESVPPQVSAGYRFSAFSICMAVSSHCCSINGREACVASAIMSI